MTDAASFSLAAVSPESALLASSDAPHGERASLSNQNPFSGLRPFLTKYTHFFFGRDTHSFRIIEKLRHNHFVAVVGTSGVGKSSLVKAGVVPLLYGGFMFGEDSSWTVTSFCPGSNPIENMAKALAKDGYLEEKVDELEKASQILESLLHQKSAALYELHSTLKKDKLLLIVDQFEEIFRLRETVPNWAEQSSEFVNLLLECAKHPNIYVLTTMRSDFLGPCARFPELAQAISDAQYLTPRMTRPELQQAISGPVSVVGASMDPKLVTRLLNDLGTNPDDLPQLQHVLMRIFSLWSEPIRSAEVIIDGDTMRVGLPSQNLKLTAIDATEEIVALNRRVVQYAKQFQIPCVDLPYASEILWRFANRWLSIDTDVDVELPADRIIRKIITHEFGLDDHLTDEDYAYFQELIKKYSIAEGSGNSSHSPQIQLTDSESKRIITSSLLAYWRLSYKRTFPIEVAYYEEVGANETAIEKHAMEIQEKAGFTPQQKIHLAKIFQALTVKHQDGTCERRPHNLDSLAKITGLSVSEVTTVVDPFLDSSAGFLMTPQDTVNKSDAIIDISHESLIRLWEDLKTWAEQEQKNAARYHQLMDAFKEKWSITGKQMYDLTEWQRRAKPTFAWTQQYTPQGSEEEFRRALNYLNRSNHRHKVFWRSFYGFSSAGVILCVFLSYLIIGALWISSITNKDENVRLTQEVDAIQSGTDLDQEANTDTSPDPTTDVKPASAPLEVSPSVAEVFDAYARGDMQMTKKLVPALAQDPDERLNKIANSILSDEFFASYEHAPGPLKTRMHYNSDTLICAAIHDAAPKELRFQLECVWGVTGMFHPDSKTRVSPYRIMVRTRQPLRDLECFMPLLIQTCTFNPTNVEGLRNAAQVIKKTDRAKVRPYLADLRKIYSEQSKIPPLEQDSLMNFLNSIDNSVDSSIDNSSSR